MEPGGAMADPAGISTSRMGDDPESPPRGDEPMATFRSRDFAPESTNRWHVAARLLNFGSPLVAAVLAASSTKLLREAGAGGMVAAELVVIGNGGLAVAGAAAGAALRPGRVGVRIGGAVAYGILALFIYAIVTALLDRTLR